MVEFRFVGRILLVFLCAGGAACAPNFFENREALLELEEERNLGGCLELSEDERRVNETLMAEKMREVSRGFEDPSTFLPARSFLETKPSIDESEVFRMIRKMPKGAVLHVHDKAMSSEEYFLETVTRREGVYVCDGENDLKLRFVAEDNDGCEWKLLSKLREDPRVAGRIDEKIRTGISMKNGSALPDYEDGYVAWSKFNLVYEFVSPLLTYRPVFEDNYYRGLEELYEDNVIYAEIRAPLSKVYELDGRVYSALETMAIYKNLTDLFVGRNPGFVGARIIYSKSKGLSDEKFDEFLRNAVELRRQFPEMFAGIDLVGHEDKSRPLLHWVRKILEADPGMTYFFHAGETNWNGLSVDENLLDAVLLGSKRIGHGYALPKHPGIMEEVKRRGIAIEICPISNQVLKLVEDLRNHPASELFVDGVPLVVSNDDPALWGARALSYDFYEAFVGIMSARADLRSLKQLALNSLKYSSLDDERKERAIGVWEQQWKKFVESFGTTEPVQLSSTEPPTDEDDQAQSPTPPEDEARGRERDEIEVSDRQGGQS